MFCVSHLRLTLTLSAQYDACHEEVYNVVHLLTDQLSKTWRPLRIGVPAAVATGLPEFCCQAETGAVQLIRLQ